MNTYRVSWRSGRLVGSIGITYPGCVVVDAEDVSAARIKAYDTHEHLLGVEVRDVTAEAWA